MTAREETEVISLAEAAERLDVHYMTAYRWVRTGLLDARKVGGQWKLDAADLAAPKRLQAGRRPARRGSVDVGDLAEVADRLARRLLEGDEPASFTILDQALARGLDPELLHVGLLGPALRRIGDRWADGEIGIGDEHRATAVAHRLVGRLGPAFRRPGIPRHRVVVGTIEGDRHGLPVALLSDILRARNVEVTEAGADVPALAIVSLVSSELGPDERTTAALCATVGDNDKIAPMIATIRSARPHATILLGGAAIRDEAHALALGATHWTGVDGRSAADAIVRSFPPAPTHANEGSTT